MTLDSLIELLLELKEENGHKSVVVDAPDQWGCPVGILDVEYTKKNIVINLAMCGT